MNKILIVMMISIIGILSYGVYGAFYVNKGDFNVNKGDLISVVESPSGKYTIKAYVSSGGATTDFAVLGELNYNTINKKPKKLYWNYHESTADIRWIDDETVVINGYKLNVINDVFDFRTKE